MSTGLLQLEALRNQLKLEQVHREGSAPQKDVIWSWGRVVQGLLGKLRKR